MVNYKSRWLSIVILNITLLGTAYLGWLQPLAEQYKNLTDETVRLQQALLEIKAQNEKIQLGWRQQIAHPNQQKREPDYLSSLYGIATEAKMRVASLNRLSSLARLPNAVHLRLTLFGSYLGVIEFATLLVEKHIPIVLLNFSYSKNKAVFDAEVIPYLKEDGVLLKKSELLHDPFCIEHAIDWNEESLLTSVSYKQITMKGYFKQKNQWIAFVAVPGGRELEVRIGKVVGSERAVVTFIDKDTITLRAHNGTKVYINRNPSND